jgi:hypothetical protein
MSKWWTSAALSKQSGLTGPICRRSVFDPAEDLQSAISKQAGKSRARL